MRLTVLGCSGGFPTVGRACSGYLLETETERVWIDAGAGTLDALLRSCDPWDLDAIWISHLHADHWTDLPIALHRMALTRPDSATPVGVYGPPGWVDGTGVTTRWRLEDDEPVLVAHELSDQRQVEVGTLTLQAWRTEHLVETYGVRAEHGSSVVAYSADSAPCAGIVNLADDADLFVCEAAARDEDSPRHMSPTQAGQAAAAARARVLMLTHLWPTADPEAAREEASGVYDGQIVVAADGLELQVP